MASFTQTACTPASIHSEEIYPGNSSSSLTWLTSALSTYSVKRDLSKTLKFIPAWCSNSYRYRQHFWLFLTNSYNTTYGLFTVVWPPSLFPTSVIGPHKDMTGVRRRLWVRPTGHGDAKQAKSWERIGANGGDTAEDANQTRVVFRAPPCSWG